MLVDAMEVFIEIGQRLYEAGSFDGKIRKIVVFMMTLLLSALEIEWKIITELKKIILIRG